MEPWMWIVIGVVAALAVAAVIAVIRRRTSGQRRLEQRFGDEYDRTVERADSREQAHEELERRIERRDSFDLRSLDEGERDRYVERWREAQRTFVRQPATGLLEADGLLTSLLADVGYPTDGFEQQAADLSAAHSAVVHDYRAGRATVRDVREGRAGTEEIRSGLLRYRTVFERVAEATVATDSDEARS